MIRKTLLTLSFIAGTALSPPTYACPNLEGTYHEWNIHTKSYNNAALKITQKDCNEITFTHLSWLSQQYPQKNAKIELVTTFKLGEKTHAQRNGTYQFDYVGNKLKYTYTRAPVETFQKLYSIQGGKLLIEDTHTNHVSGLSYSSSYLQERLD